MTRTNILMWAFTIAMAINLATATITVLDKVFGDKEPSYYANKLIGALSEKFKKDSSIDYITYQTSELSIVVFSNEYAKGLSND